MTRVSTSHLDCCRRPRRRCHFFYHRDGNTSVQQDGAVN